LLERERAREDPAEIKKRFEDITEQLERHNQLLLGQNATAHNAANKVFLPSGVTQKISKWMGDPSSAFLWIEDPVSTAAAEKQLELIALRSSSSC